MTIKEFGLKAPKSITVTTVEEAVIAADRFGYPVALKIVSPDILHKSDVGGVRTLISSASEVENSYAEIMENVSSHLPAAEILGIEVQEMILDGIEVIIGLIQDPQFGMTIMFGLGGIFTEILKDVSFRILPISKDDAVSMIHEIKGYPILKGFRNQKPVSEDMLIDLLLTIGKKGYEFRDTLEAVDFNPVLVWEDQYRVVDAKFIYQNDSTEDNDRKTPNIAHLDHFFTPRSIAVIGASNTKGKVGNVVFDSLVSHDFEGSVYPVNPRHNKIQGKDAYASLSDIPYDIDLAVMTTDIKYVPDVLKDCSTKNVHNLVIISGGGKELGGGYARLEKEIKEQGDKLGVRMIGPNCTGVFDGRSRVATFFQGFNRMSRPKDGSVAFMTQSGTVGLALLEDAQSFGVRSYVSYGNRIDVDEADLLTYWGNDPDIKVIGMYVEGFESGRKFLNAAKTVSQKKPVIIYKAARTKEGAKASASHTGNLGGNYKIVQGALQQAGLITVDSYDELKAGIKVIAMQPQAKGKRVGMISNGAGSMIQAIDYFSDIGLSLPTLAEETLKNFEAKYPPFFIINNPVDVTGSGTSDDYIVGIRGLLNDPNIDIVMPWFVFVNNPLEEDIVEKLNEVNLESNKPIIVGAFGGGFSKRMAQALEEKGIPAYQSVQDWVTAAKVIGWNS